MWYVAVSYIYYVNIEAIRVQSYSLIALDCQRFGCEVWSSIGAVNDINSPALVRRKCGVGFRQSTCNVSISDRNLTMKCFASKFHLAAVVKLFFFSYKCLILRSFSKYYLKYKKKWHLDCFVSIYWTVYKLVKWR